MAWKFEACDLNDMDSVRNAIEKAGNYAEQNGKMLTLERVAAALGIDRQMLSKISQGKNVEYKGKKIRQDVLELIKNTTASCLAELIEDGLDCSRKNNGINLYLCKVDYGMDDQPPQQTSPSVIFIKGDDMLQD